MNMNLTEHSESIVDIGEKAGKEYSIETSMAKMKEEWLSVEFLLNHSKTQELLQLQVSIMP